MIFELYNDIWDTFEADYSFSDITGNEYKVKGAFLFHKNWKSTPEDGQ